MKKSRHTRKIQSRNNFGEDDDMRYAERSDRQQKDNPKARNPYLPFFGGSDALAFLVPRNCRHQSR